MRVRVRGCGCGSVRNNPLIHSSSHGCCCAYQTYYTYHTCCTCHACRTYHTCGYRIAFLSVTFLSVFHATIYHLWSECPFINNHALLIIIIPIMVLITKGHSLRTIPPLLHASRSSINNNIILPYYRCRGYSPRAGQDPARDSYSNINFNINININVTWLTSLSECIEPSNEPVHPYRTLISVSVTAVSRTGGSQARGTSLRITGYRRLSSRPVTGPIHTLLRRPLVGGSAL